MLQYRKLYEGPVIGGTARVDKGYVWAADQILEIDLRTAAVRSLCSLPVTLNYIP